MRARLFYVDYGLECLAAVEVRLAGGAEGNRTGFERKKGVVFSDTYVGARKGAGAALADDDIALLRCFAGIELNTEVFRL